LENLIAKHGELKNLADYNEAESCVQITIAHADVHLLTGLVEKLLQEETTRIYFGM